MKRNDPCHCGSGAKFKKCCGVPELDVYDYLGNRIPNDSGDNPHGYACIIAEFPHTTQTELLQTLNGQHPDGNGKVYHLTAANEKGSYRFDHPKTVRLYRDMIYPDHYFLIMRIPEQWRLFSTVYHDNILTAKDLVSSLQKHRIA